MYYILVADWMCGGQEVLHQSVSQPETIRIHQSSACKLR